MDLARLGEGLPGGPWPAQEVSGLADDSRRVQPGQVFVALPGTRTDGASHAAEAVRRGAAAVVAEVELPGLGVPVIRVPDARSALGQLADRWYGQPSREVAVTGVTGTNGKSTTTFLLHWILEVAGRPATLLGTVVNRVAGQEVRARMTTPGALELQDALARSRDAGYRHLVMEVSSHALDQRRVAGMRTRCAVFTNLTRDHLDYHGTLEAYGDAKARLFEQVEPDGVSVLNARDPFSVELARRSRARVLRYGWALGAEPPAGADVAAAVLEERLDGTRLRVRFPDQTLTMAVPLVGRFNVENALAAAAAAWAQGVAPERIRAALEASQGVPGRLEPVALGPGRPAVLVDYAHTPDALERVTETLRPLVQGRLVVVFGCGGDRDRGKRAPMGRAVSRVADVAWVTSDNPRSEDPDAIIAQVLEGMDGPAQVRVEADRRRAIERAIAAAGPRDLVLLAGKGHEAEQVIQGRVLPFSDQAVAQAVAGPRARAG